VTVAEVELPDGTPKPMPGGACVVVLPLSATACGLSAALSAKVNIPVEAPEEVGAKVTVIVQAEEEANDVPQLLLSSNGPLICIREICRERAPELVSVTV
jgi:hypothetical protein